MQTQTVQLTAELGLCTSCGICKNTCPTNSISWIRKQGMFIPNVNSEKCISCGICSKVCPGLKFDYSGLAHLDEENIVGEVIDSYSAWSKNERLRHVSASGGVVSSLIHALLAEDEYDVAFGVDQYNYSNQVCSKPIKLEDIQAGIGNTSVPKSRYIPISHENVVSYVKEFPNKKIIFVGTSCAVRGFENIIKQYKLNRENYLLIGLFCDKIFNYNINEYFAKMNVCGGQKLKQVHFKNKDSGGWPGNMKFMFSDGTTCFVDANERMKMKEYFMPERCMYCIDKLNTRADISVGDNFTKFHSSSKGSNSVIIRTDRGNKAWSKARCEIESHNIPVSEIAEVQNVKGRWNNYTYSVFKQTHVEKKGIEIDLNKGINKKNISNVDIQKWNDNLEKVYAGAIFDVNPAELEKQLFKQEAKKKREQILSLPVRILRKIKKVFFK